MKTLKIFLLLSLITTYPSFTQTWEFVGLDSMIINNLVVKGDTLWAGTRDFSIDDNSGLYKSIDRGQTWMRLDSLLGSRPIIYFQVDEENNANIHLIKGYGIAGDFYRTTNEGTNWDTIGTPSDYNIKDFLISPLSSTEYYVIIYFSVINGNYHIFYKTTNSGENWEYKCCPMGEFGIKLNFTADHFNANILYISGRTLYSFVRKSTDRGETWEVISNPSPARIFSDYVIQNRLYKYG